jgi:predicted nuclease of restriction endonuclease-like (RecB) superfamily
MKIVKQEYQKFLVQIKSRIQIAQTKAVLSVNAELIYLYWDIGRMIEKRQKTEGWGAGIIPNLSKDIRNELPEIKGFSERNLKRMIRFFREYPNLGAIMPRLVARMDDSLILQQPVARKDNSEKVPQPVAQLEGSNVSFKLQQFVAHLPWGHNILLIEKVKNLSIRLWYMQKTIENGWSRNVLGFMIDGNAHQREGKAVTNFDARLPSPQSDLAKQSLKDPYIFDFLTLEEPFKERELETGLVRHLEKFLLELGQGFAFIGRQYHLEIGDNDFYIDLLFYHLVLRCFIVIELKKGAFKPDYAGKMNFYCNVVDDKLKQKADNQTIGLILCQDKNKVVAEYALRGFNKPIGISEYELTRALPDNLKSSLPAVEKIEEELKTIEDKKDENEKIN